MAIASRGQNELLTSTKAVVVAINTLQSPNVAVTVHRAVEPRLHAINAPIMRL
jgi:hypothetical protein